MYTIPSSFQIFISPDCDRAAFIQNYLNDAGLEAPILQMEGKNHIYVKFPQNQYNPTFRIKTVIAHYDRIGIGANDNSAAVFCLLEWAAEIARFYCGAQNTAAGGPLFHNIRLIFTDGEELGAAGVAAQGAFPLAQVFRRLCVGLCFGFRTLCFDCRSIIRQHGSLHCCTMQYPKNVIV